MESLARSPMQGSPDAPREREPWVAQVIEAARRSGRTLEQHEADTGQVVWQWSRSDGTGPLFLTRRAALTWMADALRRVDPRDLA